MTRNPYRTAHRDPYTESIARTFDYYWRATRNPSSLHGDLTGMFHSATELCGTYEAAHDYLTEAIRNRAFSADHRTTANLTAGWVIDCLVENAEAHVDWDYIVDTVWDDDLVRAYDDGGEV